MELNLKPLSIPFSVGDVVFVNQPYTYEANEDPFFEGEIIQIILDGTLHITSVIRSKEVVHDIRISNAIYDIRPIGKHKGSPRISIQVNLLPLEKMLFEHEADLKQYRISAEYLATEGEVKQAG